MLFLGGGSTGKRTRSGSSGPLASELPVPRARQSTGGSARERHQRLPQTSSGFRPLGGAPRGPARWPGTRPHPRGSPDPLLQRTSLQQAEPRPPTKGPGSRHARAPRKNSRSPPCLFGPTYTMRAPEAKEGARQNFCHFYTGRDTGDRRCLPKRPPRLRLAGEIT